MLTAGDALPKTLAKSQKVTFWSKRKWLLMLFFGLTAGDALRGVKFHFSAIAPHLLQP